MHTEPPIYGSRVARVPLVARLQRALHANTRTSVISDFLLLRAGDRCDEARRQESERILRAQPYLADARILVISRGPGLVDLDIYTVDEVSSIAALQFGEAPVVRKVRLGSQNVLGLGFYLSGEWQSGGAYRDGYAVRFITSQVFREALQFSLTAARWPLGGEWAVELSRPFLTRFQRIAWDALVGHDADYLEFRGGPEPVALRTDRRFASTGVLARLGGPNVLALGGASLSFDGEETSMSPVFVRDTGLAPASVPELAGRYGPLKSSRLNLLLGWRQIDFLRVSGFEALEGPQDLWRGVQIGTLAGKGIKRLFGGESEDLFVAVDAYVGLGSTTSFLATRGKLEQRWDQADGRWDRSIGSLMGTWYDRRSARHVRQLSVRAAAARRSMVPFQLVLDDHEAGVIGFRGSRSAGGRRVTGRLEDRLYLGRPMGSAAVGASAFLEAGRLWAGDVPFGVTTPLAVSAGLGLLAAIPPRSQRVWRLELATRLTGDPHAGRLELRLASRDRTRELLQEPPDVTRSRVRSAPTNLFVWPQGRGLPGR